LTQVEPDLTTTAILSAGFIFTKRGQLRNE
jgi:hypothetical protein